MLNTHFQQLHEKFYSALGTRMPTLEYIAPYSEPELEEVAKDFNS